MFRKPVSGVIVAVILVMFWGGCSDDTITTVTSGGSNDLAVTGVTEYFPLSQGFSSMYEVENDGITEIVIYTIGKEVSFSGGTATEWISYQPSIGYDTGYFKASSTALYYYSDLTSSPDKILELPLKPGQTWIRSDYSSTNEQDSTTTFFDKYYVFVDTNYVVNPKEDDYGGGYAKNYPTAGEISMTVEKIELVQLEDGSVYSGSVKVVNQNTNGTYNVYWFAPGIGLVKYVIGAPSTDGVSGIEMGELKSWGY